MLIDEVSKKFKVFLQISKFSGKYDKTPHDGYDKMHNCYDFVDNLCKTQNCKF